MNVTRLAAMAVRVEGRGRAAHGRERQAFAEQRRALADAVVEQGLAATADEFLAGLQAAVDDETEPDRAAHRVAEVMGRHRANGQGVEVEFVWVEPEVIDPSVPLHPHHTPVV